MIPLTRENKIDLLIQVGRYERRLKNKYGVEVQLIPRVKSQIVGPTENEIVDKIFEVVCRHHNVTRAQLESKSRKRILVMPRHRVAVFISTINPRTSLKEIGRQLGNRDHSTVIHAKECVNDLIETDKRYRADFETLELKVNEAIKELQTVK